MRLLLVTALLTGALGLAGCATPVPTPDTTGPAPGAGITVTSPDFTDGAMLPARYTCRGAGDTPTLRWSPAPAGTAAISVTLVDPDAPSGHYTHWAVFDLPPSTRQLTGAAIPPPARQATNSAGTLGYTPPCPPSGTHHYRFSVVALRSPVELPDAAAADTAAAAIAADTLARGTLTATVTH